jgi:HK97 family phage prohead protease
MPQGTMKKTLLSSQRVVKSYTFEAKQVDQKNYIVEGIFSTAAIDRHGEVVVQEGWKLDDFLKNPVVLWCHDNYSFPLAQMVRIGFENGDLAGAMKFAVEEYDVAATAFRLVQGKYLRAFSVGFMNNIYEIDNGNDIMKLIENVLLEVSVVNVPANAEALAKFKKLDILEGTVTKGVVPFSPYTTAPEETAWDASTIESDVWGDGTNQADYAKIHSWYDDSQNDDDGDGYPDLKSAYKLPHHQANYKVVWRGVAAAMAALLGGRGGVAIPDADRKGVYEHLAKHYAQFAKEVPAFKEYTDDELKQIAETGNIEAVSTEEKETLTPSNKETIRSAIRTLTRVLNAETEADTQVGKKVEHPSRKEGGKKEIRVSVLNRAIKELLNIKKSAKK